MASIGNNAPESRRLGVIDGLRGLAILGILIMNIQAFGRIERAYLLPDIHEPLSVLDRWFQGLGYFLAEQVFVSLLSCLFGIGIWLLAQNDQRAGRNPVAQQRRRSLGLLFIGLLHAYLIWTGDILVAYALTAWLLAPAVHWSALRQWQIGLLCLAVMPALGVLEVVAIPVESRQAIYSADPAAFQAEIQALTGAWWQNQHWRMARTLEVHLLGLPFGTLWFVAGWMLVGMALYRSGFAAGGWSSRSYMRVMVATLLAGLLIKAVGYPLHFQPAWISLSWSLFSQLGAACQMLAYISLAMLLWRFWPTLWICRLLEAIGRMALTNYLLQSLIATSLFYGFGLGWFEGLNYAQLVLVTIGIWAINAFVTMIWLRYFRLGPMEGLWRWQSRGRPRPVTDLND